MPPDNARKMKGNLPLTQSFSPNPYIQNSLYFKQESVIKTKDRKRQQPSTFIIYVTLYMSSACAENPYTGLLEICFVFIQTQDFFISCIVVGSRYTPYAKKNVKGTVMTLNQCPKLLNKRGNVSIT